MRFRVNLGFKDGQPVDRADIPKAEVYWGDLVAGLAGENRVARLLNDNGRDLVLPLYSPYIVRVNNQYMELGGSVEDGRPQSWIMRFWPIEGTKEYGDLLLQLGQPNTFGSMAHFNNGKR